MIVETSAARRAGKPTVRPPTVRPTAVRAAAIRRHLQRVGCLTVLLAALLPVANAAASIGPLRGVLPDHGPVTFGAPHRQTPRLFAPVSCPQPQPDPACNLTYHNGPVVQTNTTHVVYWEPAGSGGVSANYHSLIQQYLTDAAADSNRATNVYAVATQYFDNTGPGGSNLFLKYQQSFGGASTDTTAYPATVSGCPTTDGTNTVANCLTQTQESTELDNFIQAQGLPRGLNNLYFLVLPKGVETCSDDFSQCGNILNTSPNRYCAYHSSFNLSGHGLTIWANEPYIGISQKHCASDTASSPNGDDADHEINPLSHEHNEIITDPTSGGWFDVNGAGENGDKCNFMFAADIGSTANGGYDQVINHHPYEIQQEWSNAITGCAPNYGAVAPTAAFSSTPSGPHISDPVSFDGSGSGSNDAGGYLIKYSWDFGDGQTATSASLNGATPTTSHTYGAANTYTVTLTVTDDAGMISSVSHDVVVTTRPTTTTYTGPNTGDYNDPVTLSATLSDKGTAAAIQNQTLTFTLGAESCTGTTDSTGTASCSVTPLDDPATYTLGVSFGGDATYTQSADSKSFVVTQEESHLAYTGAVTSHYHDPVTASGRLTDPDGGAPIAGKTIKFTLGSGDTCSAQTNGSGDAACSITPTQSGTQTIVASFPGDTDYVSSSDSKSFAITPEETTMAYTGPTVILAGSSGATLTARLVEDGSNDNDGDGGSAAPSPAESVTLTVGTQSCTATTDLSGNVSCTIPAVTVPLGPETVAAAFAGDGFYQPSSDSKSAIVFAFPSGGAFTLGDSSVASASPTTNLTWWGADWSNLNRLSGGTAPSAFKGFADSVKLPTTSPAAPGACRPAWTTSPGNSSSPPGTVPSYMGTLVTSQATKSGSQIAGNTTHIVVVKTNSGYAGNPGHGGSGQVVATFC
jgi:hypothetical protein